MKRQTSKQKRLDWSDALKCLKRDQPPERLNSRRRDGSLPTHPRIKMQVPERDVLKACLLWLKQHHVKADRQNNGAHQDASGFHTYGIVGSGDIIGLLPDGTHLEVECKAGYGGSLSVAQQKRMRDIRSNNGVYIVVHSVEEMADELKGRLSDEVTSDFLECDPENPGEEEYGGRDCPA